MNVSHGVLSRIYRANEIALNTTIYAVLYDIHILFKYFFLKLYKEVNKLNSLTNVNPSYPIETFHFESHWFPLIYLNLKWKNVNVSTSWRVKLHQTLRELQIRQNENQFH
jgi:hypothetical protein